MPPVALVHGGLYDGTTGAWFWGRTGVVHRLAASGFEVTAPDRLPNPRSWQEEAVHLAHVIPRAAAVVAGSNGCAAAVRLALDHGVGSRLVLCWPATAGDDGADGVARMVMDRASVPPEVQDALLRGGTLRGVSDEELSRLDVPVWVVPSQPENRHHQRTTVDRLLARVPRVAEAAAFPESPHPAFPAHVDDFVAELCGVLTEPPPPVRD